MEFLENFWFSILIGIAFFFYDYFRSKFDDLSLMLLFALIATAIFALILILISFDLDLPFSEISLTPVDGPGGKLVYMLWAFVTLSVLYLVVFVKKRLMG